MPVSTSEAGPVPTGTPVSVRDEVKVGTMEPEPWSWQGRRGDGMMLGLLAGWLAVLFGLVWNPFWVPTGDSEVFLVVARNLLHGHGLTFNGQPIAFIPPGWPLVLAGLLRLTDQYLWLKLVQIGSMSVYLLTAYALLRRFTTRRVAGWGVALAAILSPLYPLTYWLHSDAFYCAIAAVTGLLAVLWADRRIGGGWLALIVALCIVGVVVRWAAVAQVFVLAAMICGSGRPARELPRMRIWPYLAPRHWLGIAAVVVATFGTFTVLKLSLKADITETAAFAPSAGPTLALAAIPGTQPSLEELIEPETPEEIQPPSLLILNEEPGVPLAEVYLNRFLSIPQWFSWTLFQPLRVARGFGPLGLWFDRGVGLLAIAMLVTAARRGMRPRGDSGRTEPHYLWLGVLIYICALAMNWPHVNNRYLVPVAPFLTAGILAGLRELSGWVLFRGLRLAFITAVLAINGTLWAVDVWVFRSPTAEDFYARYEAGIHQSLIDIASFLAEQPPLEDEKLVASLRYENLHERWDYKLSPRAILLISGHPVEPVPGPLTGWGVRKAQSWARENNVRYYVQQNPTMPGRVWHFRVTPEVQQAITGYLPAPSRPQFELYEMLPDPSPQNPNLLSLRYRPVPAVRGERLEEIARHVPGVE